MGGRCGLIAATALFGARTWTRSVRSLDEGVPFVARVVKREELTFFCGGLEQRLAVVTARHALKRSEEDQW